MKSPGDSTQFKLITFFYCQAFFGCLEEKGENDKIHIWDNNSIEEHGNSFKEIAFLLFRSIKCHRPMPPNSWALPCNELRMVYHFITEEKRHKKYYEVC